MQQKIFPVILIGMFGISLFSIFSDVFSTKPRPVDQYQVNVQQVVPASSGLDLKLAAELLKKSSSAEEFEKILNDPKIGANNLDLNGDGKIDFIKVTEFGDEKVKGFSLSTEPAPGEEQEIATIKIERAADEKASATVETQGNPQIYGQNHYYHSSWSGMGTGLMLGYLFGSHRMYSSPFGFGNHPPHFTASSPSSTQAYQQRSGSMVPQQSYQRGSSGQFDHVNSPNKLKSASSIKAPLKSPTRSQKAFQARKLEPRKSGGFGKKSKKISSPRPRSMPRRSGGFGGFSGGRRR